MSNQARFFVKKEQTHIEFETVNVRQFSFSPFKSFSSTLLIPQAIVPLYMNSTLQARCEPILVTSM